MTALELPPGVQELNVFHCMYSLDSVQVYILKPGQCVFSRRRTSCENSYPPRILGTAQLLFAEETWDLLRFSLCRQSTTPASSPSFAWKHRTIEGRSCAEEGMSSLWSLPRGWGIMGEVHLLAVERLNIHDGDVQSHFFFKSGLGVDDSPCSRERMQITIVSQYSYWIPMSSRLD